MRNRKYLESIVNKFLNFLLNILCSIDAQELEKLPRNGPYIIAMNHINFLEVPLIYLRLLPRNMSGLAKKETWDTPLISFLAHLWDAIPVNRGFVDSEAFREMQKRIKQGKILVIAPEGTRSKSGVLGKGHAGIIIVAHKAGVPIWPVAHYGGESFWHNIKRLKKTRIHFKVSSPVYLPHGSLTRSERQKVLSNVMYSLAGLLPNKYRGTYV
jgi:1-acyl-sn-glycerol-3-phosphate acyltransferase